MLTTMLSMLLGVVVVFVITAFTGYFVAQEFAFMTVDRSRLRAGAEQGDQADKRTLRVTNRTSFMLSGAQLGITLTGLLVGYVAEPLIGNAFGHLTEPLGIPLEVGIAVGTVVALIFATGVQMLFGELFPKNLGIARPYPVARWLSRSTLIYLALFGWLIWFFDNASNLLLRALRIEPVHDVESSASASDLEYIVADSRESGDLSPEMSILLDRVLDFPRHDVEHAMVPRSRVDHIDSETTLAEVRDLMQVGHSRYPVLEDDSILGVVHLADVLGLEAARATDRWSESVTTLVRPAVIVPELMPMPDALRAITGAKEQLACVIDEYGGMTGIVTVEDLVEEIVGEIRDEHDAPEGPEYRVDAEYGGWEFQGDLPIDEVERVVDRELPTGDYETIAGLLIASHHSLPEVGETVIVRLPDDPAELANSRHPEVWDLEVEVMEIENYVPSVVRARLNSHPEDEGNDDASSSHRNGQEDHR